jgi:hypothetical protein
MTTDDHRRPQVRCVVTGRIITPGRGVHVDHAREYVEKQGYTVVDDWRMLEVDEL